ncbi:DUF1217 domain-containing protein [uncultured Algimonas sp.]|uniref:DUF1217 domain-containing protein n=1 Tax=uncultured Algimonas sp. TaxID=1547920 RepID=UPI002611986A|nr:DUF1217 domain-containing protein [uncultured Algimonas sp.]
MAIQPSIVGTDLPGYLFLKATQDRQQTAFEKSTEVKRDVETLREKLAQPFKLDELMGDRSLLRPVLQSFGLEEELDKGAFVRRIIQEGPDDPKGFARRLNNADYLELSQAFKADTEGQIRLSHGQIEDIVENYKERAFQIAVGEQDQDMRLALNFEKEVSDLAADSSSDKAFWFKVIGNAPLMEVFKSALIVPDGLANLDVDKQADYLQERAEKVIGDDPRAVLATKEGVETTIRKFLVQNQIANGPSALTPGASALTLLGAGGGLGSQSLFGLLLSNA